MINSIILGFKQFLSDKNETIENTDERYDLNSSSVFTQYSDEFKEYIHETFGSKYDSLFTQGFQISDLKEIELVNGNFQKNNENKDNDEMDLFVEILNELSHDNGFVEALDTDFNGDITQDEYLSYLDTMTEDGEQIEGVKLLENFANNATGVKRASEEEITESKTFLNSFNTSRRKISNEDMALYLKIFDRDGDGALSDEEKDAVNQCVNILKNDENNQKNPLSAIKNYVDTLKEKPEYNDENLLNFIKGLDGNAEDFSVNDLLKLSEYAIANIMPNEILEAQDELSAQNSPAGSGGNAPFNPAMKQKNIDNMSIEDLENELKNAQENIKTAQTEFEATLKEQNKELAEKLSTTQENVTNTQNEITEYNSNLTEKQNSLTEAQNNVSELTSQISDLEAQLSSCEDESLKSQIKEQISALKAQKEEIENNTIPKLNEEIANINAKLEELNVQLEEFNTQYNEIQNEITTLAQNNEELAAKQEAYNQAVQYEAAVQEKLNQRNKDKQRAENVDMPSIDERSKDYSDQEGYDFTNMPMTHTLDGKEYHCVGFTSYTINGEEFKPDSWEEVQRYFANGGLANIGQFGSMQCHNYSNVMADFVIGSINTDLLEAMYEETNNPEYGDKDTAGYMGTTHEYNSRDYARCRAEDRDAERAIIENELQNGRPVLVSVPHASGTHWAVAIGMSDDGDILIWDSYDGGTEKLGCTSNSDKEKLGRNLATAHGVMVFCKGYSYQYDTAGYIDYWEMINNPDYDPLVEGIK